MDSIYNSRKEREKEARKTLILDAAARILSEKDYYEATLDEIAAEAELAKGTLYNYFKDKQDIFESLIARGHTCFEEVLTKTLCEPESLESLIRNILVRLIKVVEENKYMVRLIFYAGAHLSDNEFTMMMKDLTTKWHEASQSLAKVMGQFKETEGLAPEELHTAALLIFAAIDRIIKMSFCNGESCPPKDIDNYVRLLHRSVCTEKTI
ncbi:MAG: TetR/AcrR family transcriptional regulator [candidate division Zixibacteria bacterium]|nr:TetR/AcrR family transcriptional regulator [candidate division Zixibacteria bacterium]